VNWKILFVLPLAAVLVGERVEPPRLKPALPTSANCATFTAAKAAYLHAYAFSEDDPEENMQWREKSHQLLQACEIQFHDLEKR
jgi:hypothetical protein